MAKPKPLTIIVDPEAKDGKTTTAIELWIDNECLTIPDVLTDANGKLVVTLDVEAQAQIAKKLLNNIL